MKVIINPEYDYLRDWIEDIPRSFDREGEILHNERNIIKVFSLNNGLSVSVKKFRKPRFLNRIVYTFFRKSKAFRSYYHTFRISEKGFDTATAIACIEIREGGLLSGSYFISEYRCHVREIREYYFGPLAGNERLIDAFAQYTAALHDAGIYHLDYSPGNILISDSLTPGEYAFILVDVNRMKFLPVSPDRGCRNFIRLFGNDDIYKRIGAVYSQSRATAFDEEDAVRLILKYKNRFLQRKARKEKLKSFFKA
jgi:serine/threonine protein kinase